MKTLLANVAILFLALASLTGVAKAQTQSQQQGDSQPGVARIGVIDGNVSVLRADSGTWVTGTVNTPLMNGDTISTGPDSRAEVQLDYANVLRLDSNSSVKIANLNRSQIQVQVAQGLVSYDVLGQDQAQAEIDTPNVAVHPLGNGSYRVEVDSNQQTLVTVRRGEADVSTPQGSTRVESGQLITIEGTDNPQYQISDAGPEDSWDRWNNRRDQTIQSANSWHHTNRYYTGSQDLDPYGHWVYVPSYGQVWQPYEGPGWAPYRDGRWVWEPYYGWTWVSYAPWGWAPYHYGRWFLYANVWSWWPGPVDYYPSYYPVWAPAYVSFFGFGSGGWDLSVGFGFGNVGWLPCGPADPYFPWYGAGRSYFAFNFYDFDRYGGDYYRRYNGFAPLYRGRDGYSNFRSVFHDRRVRDGASWMSGKDFGRAPVPRQRGRMDLADFRQGHMFGGRVPVLPNRESLRATNRAPDPKTMRFGRNQRFFTHGHPAPAVRSFNDQRAQLERSLQNSRGGFGAKGRPAFTSASRGRASFGGQPGVRNGSRSQSFGRSSRPTPNFTQGRSSWHSFSPSNRTGGRNRGGNRGGNRAPVNGGRPTPALGRNNRGYRQAPAQRGGNWRGFSPSPRTSQPAQRGYSRQPASRNGSGWTGFSPQRGQTRNAPPARSNGSAPVRRGGGWQTFTPTSRSASQGGGWRGNSGRQPLNLRQPIVQRRKYNNPAPRNNQPRSFQPRSFQPRSSQPRNFQPRSYGRPSYGGSVYHGGAGRQPSYQAPRRSYGGGGAYRGGGGSYSRGGSRGGYSAPRGRSQGGSRNTGRSSGRSSGHSSGGHGRRR